jgi:hypothetical protein
MDARTEVIINSFQDSWKKTAAFYVDLIGKHPGWERYKPVKDFVEKVIANGDDRFFRASTSLATLMISRSVNFGLRDEQKFVSIEAVDKGVYEIKLRERLKTYREFRITNLADAKLHNVLETLKDTLVD